MRVAFGKSRKKIYVSGKYRKVVEIQLLKALKELCREFDIELFCLFGTDLKNLLTTKIIVLAWVF